MSRTAWKSLQPASLAAVTLLAGCNSPVSAKLIGRPADRSVATAPSPPPVATELPAGAGVLAPAWPEPTAWISGAAARPPMPDPPIPVGSVDAASERTPLVHRYLRAARPPPPEPLPATRTMPEHPLAQSAPVRAQAQAARPIGELPTLIAPVSPPPPGLPDPPAARPPAAAAAAAKAASVAPAAPARPAALSPVHKALPGTDTTPY